MISSQRVIQHRRLRLIVSTLEKRPKIICGAYKARDIILHRTFIYNLHISNSLGHEGICVMFHALHCTAKRPYATDAPSPTYAISV